MCFNRNIFATCWEEHDFGESAFPFDQLNKYILEVEKCVAAYNQACGNLVSIVTLLLKTFNTISMSMNAGVRG